jgi:hypothetical protein
MIRPNVLRRPGGAFEGRKTDDSRSLPCCAAGCNHDIALRAARHLPVPLADHDRALWVALAAQAAAHRWPDLRDTLARRLSASCRARKLEVILPQQLSLPWQ